jgi:lipoprotein-anchoring transpeptidase ErfK/SrfK
MSPVVRPTRLTSLGLRLVLCLGFAGIAAALAAAAPAATGRYPKAAVIVTPTLAAHARPDAGSRTLTVFRQFRGDFRPTTLLVLGERRGAHGVKWLKLSLPVRPNGRTGWVRATAVHTRAVDRRIVVDLSARRLRVLEGARLVYSTRVAIGRRGMETPTGRFYVTATFEPKEHFLGAHAFETSAYSTLSEWPGGGIVGLHGTSQPELLGKAVSHGCVRMSNAAALVLKRLTPAGTPLTIVV